MLNRTGKITHFLSRLARQCGAFWLIVRGGKSGRHGARFDRVDVDDIEIAVPENDEQLLAIHEHVDKLAKDDPAKNRRMKLRFLLDSVNPKAHSSLSRKCRSPPKTAHVWMD